MADKDRDLERTVDALLDALPSVWERIRSKLRAAATGKFGISAEQFHSLRHIRKGYRTVGEIAEKRQVSPAAISQSVEILVRKKLVLREADAEDRRVATLALTPHASGVLDANFAENRKWMAARMSRLTKEELGELRKAMELLKRVFAPEEGEASEKGR